MQDMKEAPPLLLPLLRSRFQGELLTWLYLHPDDEYSASELARRFMVSQSTVSREADRLTEAGLIAARRRGNLRLLRANTETAVAGALTNLLSLTFGPRPVIAELLGAVDGVSAAYIYGSWASRYHDVPGSVPRDVDVLVVGTADEDRLHQVARRAETVLGREVNIRRVSSDTWTNYVDDAFLTSVRSRPMVQLDLGGSEYEVAARQIDN